MKLEKRMILFFEHNNGILYTRNELVEIFKCSYDEISSILQLLIYKRVICKVSGYGSDKYTHIKNKDIIKDMQYKFKMMLYCRVFG